VQKDNGYGQGQGCAIQGIVIGGQYNVYIGDKLACFLLVH